VVPCQVFVFVFSFILSPGFKIIFDNFVVFGVRGVGVSGVGVSVFVFINVLFYPPSFLM